MECPSRSLMTAVFLQPQPMPLPLTEYQGDHWQQHARCMWSRAAGVGYLGEAFLEIRNLIAHIAHLLESLCGRVFCRCYPDLRGVALLCGLQKCHACHRLSKAWNRTSSGQYYC